MSAEKSEKIKEYAKSLRLLYIFNNIDDELGKNNSLSAKNADFELNLLKNQTFSMFRFFYQVQHVNC